MRKPLVIRKSQGAIQTLVVYLRGKQKPTPALRSEAINMASKQSTENKEDKAKKPKEPNKPND